MAIERRAHLGTTPHPPVSFLMAIRQDAKGVDIWLRGQGRELFQRVGTGSLNLVPRHCRVK